MNYRQRKAYYKKRPLQHQQDLNLLVQEIMKEGATDGSMTKARKVARMMLDNWHLFENGEWGEPSVSEQLTAVLSRARGNLDVLQKAMRG